MVSVLTAAGHHLRGVAKKGVRRRWVCERCDAVLQVSPDLSLTDAGRELQKLVKAHGGRECP